MLSIVLSIVFSVASVSIPSAHAYLTNAKMPVCLDGPSEMQIDNARILDFKVSTKNQFHARGFVQGRIISDPYVKTGHDRFSIAIGPKKTDTLEVVYSRKFGPMPEVRIGDDIVVCGDYITSNKPTEQYPIPSPDGALIHWAHFNPGTRPGYHEHGFMMFGSTLAGFDDAPAGDWDGTVIPTKEPGEDAASRKGGKGRNNAGYYRGRDQGRAPVRHENRAPSRPCRTMSECRARN